MWGLHFNQLLKSQLKHYDVNILFLHSSQMAARPIMLKLDVKTVVKKTVQTSSKAKHKRTLQSLRV